MPLRRLVSGLVAAALLCLPSALFAQVQITPVVSGLTAPVFVSHSGDGSNRLFILERAGRILVLPPGASVGILFLDITGKVQSNGGEQGLLGLAFHPQYATNNRFFVFYTRKTDGAIQISEFRATADPLMADATEIPLLTIPHAAATNHNGGMLAFGKDGYLYIGVGDGGSANDPPDNAQNLNVLLGKILRIDINTAAGYLSPASNPFSGATPGRDEIFAYGIRNPWRLSVDRLTGQIWVGDVGQGTKEEVNSPIVSGGNYGWRVFEGTSCTNNGPAACTPANYIFPVLEYAHAGGRCSVTGGYVYRGSQGALPSGTYVYADYCTGEIFAWTGSAQTVLLDTAMTISAFGEDQAGEIYVVNYGGGSPGAGSIGRLTPPGAACSYAINPTTRSIAWGSATGTVTVSAGAGCGWAGVANAGWLHVKSGAIGTGNGTLGYAADINMTQLSRTGTLTIAGQSLTITQDPPPWCTFSISATRATVGAAATTRTVTVTARPGCKWTAKSNVSWIKIASGSAGNGTADVTYSVAKLTGTAKRRTGTITIAKKTFTLTQTR